MTETPPVNPATARSDIRALLLAEVANPEWISVPLEGWSHSQAIARRCHAHVVTHIRNRDAFVRAGLVEGKDFTALDSEQVGAATQHVTKFLRKRGFGWTAETALHAFEYYFFEFLVWRHFGKRIKAKEFDVVHRLTPLSPTTPSIIADRIQDAGVPFLWGPINGGVPWPKGFDHVLRAEGEWLTYIRDVYKLMPGYHATRKHAAALVVGSSDTMEQVPQQYLDKCVYIPENAIDTSRFTNPRDTSEVPTLPIRAAFVGRLVPYKGADMMLEAMVPLLKDGRMTVDIFGDGQQRQELFDIVVKYDLQDAVTFHGMIPHTELQNHLRECHIFVFPSIREFGGAVVLESMALGLVPLVVRYGGPKELVTEKSGYTVEIGSREEIIERVRGQLAHIAAHPEELPAKAAAARARIARWFTWDAKAAQTVEAYEWVLGRRSKPENPCPLPD